MHPNCIPVFDSKEDNVKSPAKVQLNTSTHNSTGFTLVHGVNISITESNQIFQAQSYSGKSMLAITNQLLVFHTCRNEFNL